ncbi:uncharacterized protein LOC127129778 [Lathyrus oleraceus]|uniref:uncharacterized protein LOC127129778 n=1 Tax=Pisum sativum TaxID=3888 RepID=UPI0021D25214|nr:uncharacterized protein LOC127129778 [Pisum sativum]
MTDIPTGGVQTLHMEVGIFGFDYDQMIGNEDFMQVFSHEEIGVNVVNTYIRFLYDKLMRPNGLDVSFGFLAPATVNLVLILNRPDTVTEYVLRILMDNKDAEKLFFIPFNTGGHWLLLAINPIREIVYYLDSLGNDWTTYPDMKVLIDTVLQAFRAQRVIQTSRREEIDLVKSKIDPILEAIQALDGREEEARVTVAARNDAPVQEPTLLSGPSVLIPNPVIYGLPLGFTPPPEGTCVP